MNYRVLHPLNGQYVVHIGGVIENERLMAFWFSPDGATALDNRLIEQAALARDPYSLDADETSGEAATR